MTERTPAQTLTLLFGIVFLAVGILGFIPGITTNYDDLSFAGSDSSAELIGVFQTSVLHNLVHVVFGIAGLALARTHQGASTYLLGGGIIYAALFIYGLFVSGREDANFVPMNGADDVLHLILAVTLLGAWFATARGAVRTAPSV
jgi:hypothetical protein